MIPRKETPPPHEDFCIFIAIGRVIGYKPTFLGANYVVTRFSKT